MSERLRILILEDEPEHVELMRLLLERDQVDAIIQATETEPEFLGALDSFRPDVLVADYRLPGYDGLAALAEVRRRGLELPVLIVSGQMGEEFAVEALKSGATDYVLKTNLKRLPAAVRRAVRESRQQEACREAQEDLRRAHDELERRVKDRTADLLRANQALASEIANRRRTEQELRDSRILFGAVFSSLVGNVAVIDRTGVILAVNFGWLGFAVENGADLCQVGEGANYLEVCRRAASAGLAGAGEMVQGLEAILGGTAADYSTEYPCDAPGETRWCWMTATPLQRPEGGAIITHLDITRRREAELSVERLGEELAHFGRVSTAGELAATLAHELRQPLTAILSNTEAALDLIATHKTVDWAELREIFSDVAASARRAGEVITRLREMLRHSQPGLHPLDLNEVAREVMPLVRAQAVAHQVHLETDLAPGLPAVRGDRIQLEQLLLNLMVNAITAMETTPPAERRLTIRTSLPEPGGIEISVRDAGTGVPVGQLERIFESFFSTKPGGLGMGLSICRSIAQAHGGRIWAENHPDSGATFRLRLPVACAAEGADGAAPDCALPASHALSAK